MTTRAVIANQEGDVGGMALPLRRDTEEAVSGPDALARSWPERPVQGRPGPLDLRSVVALQAGAGNAAVARLLVPGHDVRPAPDASPSDFRRLDAAPTGLAATSSERTVFAVDRYQLEVTIPHPPRPQPGSAAVQSGTPATSTPVASTPVAGTPVAGTPVAGHRPDAMPGEEEDPTGKLGATPADGAGAAAGPAAGAAAAGGSAPAGSAAPAGSTAPAGDGSQPAADPAAAAAAPPAAAAPAAAGGDGAAAGGGDPAAGGGDAAAAAGPVSLPDITAPAEFEQLGKSDALAGVFGYHGSITKAGAAPPGFGITRSFNGSLTGVTVTSAAGVFTVRATVEHPITFQIRSGTGPGGQVDIASEGAAAITAANFATVAADLTPNMGDLNGRPPRTGFWAEDLTDRHERVHCSDDQGNAPGVIEQFRAWLAAQAAASPAEVNTLLTSFPNRFASGLLAALSTEAGERHAYGDGAPANKARADAVTAKGGRHEYH